MLSRETLRHRPSPRRLLSRVLETPNLAEQVRALPAPILAKLIEEVGLEDAGELVALATTEQLAQVFDEDLWRSERAGHDPTFDSERFLVWLEVMLEAGEHFVAERLAELPRDLLTLALHRRVLVLSEADLRDELTAGDDEAEAAEKAFENCLSEEIDEYQLIWRGGDGWDSVLSALLALDRDHHSLTVDLLERCAHLSREHIEENGGLYEVLTAEEMLENDVSAERETRRAERGHVAPSAAAAFLKLALGKAPSAVPDTEQDALTRAYFRELSRKSAVRTAPPAQASPLVGLLVGAGVIETQVAPPLLTGSRLRREPLVIAALRELSEESPDVFAERSEELAYLSNVLVAGATIGGRRVRPVEAVQHVLDAVSFGLSLACSAKAPSSKRAAGVLANRSCDGLFRLALARAAEASLQAGPKIDGPGLTRTRDLLKTLKV